MTAGLVPAAISAISAGGATGIGRPVDEASKPASLM